MSLLRLVVLRVVALVARRCRQHTGAGHTNAATIDVDAGSDRSGDVGDAFFNYLAHSRKRTPHA